MEVIILAGVSGSGKSRHATSTVAEKGGIIVSADAFPGLYRDFSLLGAAHTSCLRGFLTAVQEGTAVRVFVDNTNTTAVEIAPYLAIARAFGYEPKILRFVVSLETAKRRNVHNVPEHVLKAMLARLAEPLPPFFPPVTEVSGEGP